MSFFTTPTGLRWDGAISKDAVGSEPMNMSWNNFWDVLTQVNENVWHVEIRIPFTSLQYEPVSSQVFMGISAFRYTAVKNEVDIFPATPPDYGDWSAFKPSLFAEFSFNDVQEKRPFYITPFVLGGFSETNLLNDAETGYDNDENRVAELGLDMKYGISNNMTLDLSYNTDFAQVEADDQQINLTRFSLFFPEKRLFFQERSGIFDFNFGREDKLFYSRKIGIDEDGNPVPIYGGVRLVGRTGDLDIGLLSMQSESHDTLHSANNSVFRLKRNIFNENSDVGILVTNKVDFRGSYNTTLGLDATIRVLGDQDLSLRWAHSSSDTIPDSGSAFDRSRWWISLSRQSNRGLSIGTSISNSGKYFIPALGFNVRDNFFRIGNRTTYTWFPGSVSSLFSHGFSSGGAAHWNGDDHRLESLRWRAGWDLRTKSGWQYELRFTPQYERLSEEFELSDDAFIPVGEYHFYSFQFDMQTTFSNPLVLIFSTEYGSFYDGTKTSIQLDPMFNISKHLEISGTYEYNNIHFEERGQEFISHILRLKGLYMFSTRFSISAFLQYNSSIKSFLANLRLRYNPREGNDLYLVINGDVNRDLGRELPNLPRFHERTILVKYNYTFSF